MSEDEVLAFANALLDWGVPVVVCKPRPGSDDVVPVVSWKNLTSADQCRGLLSKYEHGRDALALIGGHGVDLIDVDTKAGGTIEPFGDFRHYGVTRTPSGGRHYVVPSTGLRRVQDLRVGDAVVGDYIGGTEQYGSRMLGFLPGSVRPKYGDVAYEFEEPWDVEGCVLALPDPRVVAILEEAGATADEQAAAWVDDGPERAPEDGVHPYAASAVRGELARLDALPRPWAPGSYWDDTTFEVACALLRLANSNWTGYSREDALQDLLEHAPRDDRWGRREHETKWRSAIEAVGEGGRHSPDDAAQDFEAVAMPVTASRPTVDVSSGADALDWCMRMVGVEGTPLAGMFRRDNDMVYTPRVGESGYVPPKAPTVMGPDGQPLPRPDDGPAQVRRLSATAFTTYIDVRYRVVKAGKGGTFAPCLFPREVATRAASTPEQMEGLRPLHAVTHTPLVRGDGSVLDVPGYDEASGILFLPDRGLTIPADPGPSILYELIEGFPFVTEHDRANFLGAMLTPLVRQLVPPPYPLVAIGAPQPGSGKSLLARLIRIVHGGVFRAEMVRDGGELRKQITSILDTTSAPVVTFDNLSGVLRSPVIDGLLTSAEWNDRILGATEDRRMTNDRLWTITGNNLNLGGDLRRRTVWVTIDPRTEKPEERTDFRHGDLPTWTEENRGALLAALLGLVRRWVEEGRPDAGLTRTDDFGHWQRIVGGVLRHAGVPGELNHQSSVRAQGLEDEDEWGAFLEAVDRRWPGGQAFRARQVVEAVSLGDPDLSGDALPEDILSKMRFDENGAAKSLGRWMMNRQGRWAGGRAVEQAGKHRSGVVQWRVVDRDTDGVL